LPRSPIASTVHRHHWSGFDYCSRLTRAAHPRLDPVVFVGGALQRKEEWGRMERAVLEAADVIAPDLPGWGEADLLPAEYGADLLADALVHLLDDLDVARVNVFGGSYGTAIAYRMAQTHPDRIARMVLVGTMTAIPLHWQETFREMIRLVTAGDLERFADLVAGAITGGAPGADIASAAAVERVLLRRFRGIDADEAAKFTANTRRLLAHAMIDTAAAPDVPILFTTGEHDALTPPDACRELAATCRRAWFTAITRADHGVHMQRSAELADLMTRFYAGEPIGGLPYATAPEPLGRAAALTP
jgi:pimeloyl-ACP methyl ester carboxylesterase